MGSLIACLTCNPAATVVQGSVSSSTAVFNLEELEAEIAELRENAPHHIGYIGDLHVPSLLADGSGGLLWPGQADPVAWDLVVSISGSQECEAYNSSFRVRLRFSRTWPAESPTIKFLTTINHWLVDEDEQELLYSFYSALAHGADPLPMRHTILSVLSALRGILLDPRSALRFNDNHNSDETSLPVACGAARYTGTLVHPAFGDRSNDLAMSVLQPLAPLEFEGKWEALGKAGRITLSVDADFKCLTISGRTAVGEVVLKGDVDESSGAVQGTCSLGGLANGTFQMCPSESGDKVASAEKANLKRLRLIKNYMTMTKCPRLFETGALRQDDWLSPVFKKAQAIGTPGAWRAILTEHLNGQVVSFPIFTEEFCNLLVEELLNFYGSGLPWRPPNSMNNYGVILKDIGFESLVSDLQQMLQPIGELLWPGPGTAWDDHHCFIVRYREGEDLGLDMHHDDSDVTFNVCLGREFGGAGLQFCGMFGAPDHRRQQFTYHHIKGRCVAHLGRHRHGADDISSGERMNLILWNRSSAYRMSEDFEHPSYDVETGPPDKVCLSYTHDRDYYDFREFAPGKEHFNARAWCPPPHAEYPGFKTTDHDQEREENPEQVKGA